MGLPYMPIRPGVVWGVNVGIYGIHGVSGTDHMFFLFTSTLQGVPNGLPYTTYESPFDTPSDGPDMCCSFSKHTSS